MTRILYCEIHIHANTSFEETARKSLPTDDVFELEDGTILSARRSAVLVWHGSNARKSINIGAIKRAYCGHEQLVLTGPDYAKCIEGIYFGRNARAWKNGVTL